MLKLKADAQPADAPGKARSAAVRIDGVSAPKNMKIGLVASGGGQGSGPEPAPARSGAAAAKTDLKSAAAAAAAAKPAVKETAKPKAVKPAAAAKPGKTAVQKPEPVPEPQPFAPVQAENTGMLPKLGLAAAGLAVASAMLLYFQFGGDAPADATVENALAVQPAAAAEPAAADTDVPAGAAAAAGLEAAGSSGEDALVARITAGTLAALRSKQAEPGAAAEAAPAVSAESTALFKMVMTAAAQGQSEAYIDQLVNGAYERQEITVPASLIGADGRVDTATLLALFVGN